MNVTLFCCQWDEFYPIKYSFRGVCQGVPPTAFLNKPESAFKYSRTYPADLLSHSHQNLELQCLMVTTSTVAFDCCKLSQLLFSQ